MDKNIVIISGGRLGNPDFFRKSLQEIDCRLLPGFGPADLLAELSFTDPNGEVQTVAQRVRLWPAAVVAGLSSFDVPSLESVERRRLQLWTLALGLLLLVASFLSRPRVFCQYLRHMTGIQLDPHLVQRTYRRKGRAGVRDLLMDLLIREDLSDPRRVVTPDSAPDTSVFEEP